MRKFHLTLLLFTIGNFNQVIAQITNDIFKIPEEIPKKYIFDYEEERKKLDDDITFSIITDTLLQNLIKDKLAYSKRELSFNGEIVYGFEECETYLNTLAQHILKDYSVEVKNKVHIYPCYSADLNAAALCDGTILFDIGCFYYLKSEAEIAAIICHELSHVIYQHPMESVEFFYQDNNKTKLSWSERIQKIDAGLSQKNETEADSLGFILFSNAGYNPLSFLSTYEKIYKLEQSLLRFKGYTKPTHNEQKLLSHPITEHRIKKLKSYVEKLNEPKKDYTTFDGVLFKKIKQSTSEGIMQILDTNGDYFALMEHAFVAYLIDPDNVRNIHYCLEGIRKYCLLNPTLWLQPFITTSYKSSSTIMDQLDEYFVNGKADTAIKAHDILENKRKVGSYNHAFKYFLEKAAEKNYTEALLSAGMVPKGTEIFSNKERLAYLQKYIASENPKHKGYAEFLMQKKVEQSDSVLVILFDVEFFKESNHDFFDKLTFDREKHRLLLENIDSNAENFSAKKVKFINLYSQRISKLNSIYQSEKFKKLGFLGDPFFYEKFIRGHNYNKILIVNISASALHWPYPNINPRIKEYYVGGAKILCLDLLKFEYINLPYKAEPCKGDACFTFNTFKKNIFRYKGLY